MFHNKVEITIRNLKSLNIEPPAYGLLLILVLTIKLPTDLLSLFARTFSGRVWELDELLPLLKNELESKERPLGSGYNSKEKLLYFLEAVVLNSIADFVKVIIIHGTDVLK